MIFSLSFSQAYVSTCPSKDLTYQDSCYWKVYLTPSEGHGIGWSKPSFWWIWCDSRGHLVLRSTSITKIYASSNPPCANLCFSFTFVRVNTANGPKSMAELNLGWFIRLLCLFLFGSNFLSLSWMQLIAVSGFLRTVLETWKLWWRGGGFYSKFSSSRL